jgi:TolB protein
MPRLLSFLLILFLLTAVPAGARIEIRAPGQQTIALALTDFVPLDSQASPDIAAELGAVLNYDLEQSGLFRQIDPQAFLDDARRPGLTRNQVAFDQWRTLGAEVLVKGGYRLEGDQLLLEARLFDVLHRRLLTGCRYRGRRTDVRRMGHKFADLILKHLTGKNGSFNTRIAFIDNRSGHKELYLMDSDGHHPVRITDHRSIVLNPDFSPTGRELIFTSYRAGNPDLFRKEIYTGQEARLSFRKGLNIAGRYRADGREIALTLSQSGNPELALIGTGGTMLRRLTQHWAIDVDPSWSPAGDRIAFVSDRQGNPHIFVLDVLSGEITRLTETGKYNATPAWSPTGDRIAFTRMENNRFDIHAIRPDGSDERRLTFGPGNKEHPRWSPDGRFLVYSSDQEGTKAIYVMRADGTGSRRISPPGGQCQHPAWSGSW